MPTSTGKSTLESALRRLAVSDDRLARPVADDESGALRCVACAHRCLIRPGRTGICRVRFNEGGHLHVPHGYVAGGYAVDPVEKKPFFHVLPGSRALSFGMLGCDMHCSYCQNWRTSQTLRDAHALGRPEAMSAEELHRAALSSGSSVVVSTYNEPLITAEWAADVFEACRHSGLVTGFVSNGNATAEVLDFISPVLDVYKVDLKSFRDAPYRKLGAVLDNVLDGIRLAAERGLWVEIVTLVVPGLNDEEDELRDMARFVASVGKHVPWHVTAFHGDYRMVDHERTPIRTLLRAWEIGHEEGLSFVYTGNLWIGGRTESTSCPSCGRILIERSGYRVRVRGLEPDGRCSACNATVPGIWHAPPTGAA